MRARGCLIAAPQVCASLLGVRRLGSWGMSDACSVINAATASTSTMMSLVVVVVVLLLPLLRFPAAAAAATTTRSHARLRCDRCQMQVVGGHGGITPHYARGNLIVCSHATAKYANTNKQFTTSKIWSCIYLIPAAGVAAQTQVRPRRRRGRCAVLPPALSRARAILHAPSRVSVRRMRRCSLLACVPAYLCG